MNDAKFSLIAGDGFPESGILVIEDYDQYLRRERIRIVDIATGRLQRTIGGRPIPENHQELKAYLLELIHRTA